MRFYNKRIRVKSDFRSLILKKSLEEVLNSLKKIFQKISSEYLLERKNEFRKNSLAGFVRNEAVNIVKELAKIDTNKYKIKASVGQGGWAHVPWLGIFDKEITRSAEKGYYLVYLFSESMDKIYLILEQGWTHYEKKYGRKVGTENIIRVSNKLNKELKISEKNIKKLEKISLGEGELALGYKNGCICGIEYDTTNIPDDSVLLNDLRVMMAIYLELKSLVGEKDFNKIIESLALDDSLFTENEDLYEEAVEKAEVIKEIKGPQVKIAQRETGAGKRFARNPSVAKTAINKANYSCEFDSTHTSFNSKYTNKMYVEAHHLIPVNFEDNFEYSLDIGSNIVSLCPNCHRKIHNAISEERNIMIEKLFNERKEYLKKQGIEITLEDLKNKYE